MPLIDRTQDFHFEVPDDWVNRSMIVWSAPPRSGPAVTSNILVAYDTLREAENLSQYVGRQLKELITKGSNFHLELRRDSLLDGRPAIELVFQWDAPSGRLKQRQIYSVLMDGRVMTFVNTAAVADFEAAESQFDVIVKSFGWNEPR